MFLHRYFIVLGEISTLLKPSRALKFCDKEALVCDRWELTPGLSALRKEQVLFKIFYAKRIYFSFELQIINTNSKLTRISNLPLRSVGSNRELFTR